MRTSITRGRLRVGTLVASALIIGALIVTSAGVATARSRAANRWNHVATAPATVSAELAGELQKERAVKIIRLDEVFSDAFTFVDVGEPGDSPGDYGVFQDPVAHPRTGRILGTVDVQCIAAYADQCRGSIKLPGRGQITFDGITPLGVNPDSFAITGGTGEFLDAGGRLIVSFPNQSSARLTIRLTD